MPVRLKDPSIEQKVKSVCLVSSFRQTVNLQNRPNLQRALFDLKNSIETGQLVPEKD